MYNNYNILDTKTLLTNFFTLLRQFQTEDASYQPGIPSPTLKDLIESAKRAFEQMESNFKLIKHEEEKEILTNILEETLSIESKKITKKMNSAIPSFMNEIILLFHKSSCVIDLSEVDAMDLGYILTDESQTPESLNILINRGEGCLYQTTRNMERDYFPLGHWLIYHEKWSYLNQIIDNRRMTFTLKLNSSFSSSGDYELMKELLEKKGNLTSIAKGLLKELLNRDSPSSNVSVKWIDRLIALDHKKLITKILLKSQFLKKSSTISEEDKESLDTKISIDNIVATAYMFEYWAKNYKSLLIKILDDYSTKELNSLYENPKTEEYIHFYLMNKIYMEMTQTDDFLKESLKHNENTSEIEKEIKIFFDIFHNKLKNPYLKQKSYMQVFNMLQYLKQAHIAGCQIPTLLTQTVFFSNEVCKSKASFNDFNALSELSIVEKLELEQACLTTATIPDCVNEIISNSALNYLQKNKPIKNFGPEFNTLKRKHTEDPNPEIASTMPLAKILKTEKASPESAPSPQGD